MLGYQLPWAYRRFLRPSSPLDAKTSTVCPFKLDRVDPTPSMIARIVRTDLDDRRVAGANRHASIPHSGFDALRPSA